MAKGSSRLSLVLYLVLCGVVILPCYQASLAKIWGSCHL